MSKPLTKELVENNKKKAFDSMEKLLQSYIDDPSGDHLKKANLISYWLRSYVDYIQQEEAFDSTKLKSYKRGDIVKLNFGFNVGSEYGGLHYGIVINNHNPRNSSVLTVIPLTSHKDNNPIHDNDVFLGNELYRSLKLKYDTLSQNLQKEKEEIDRMVSLFDSMLDAVDKKLLSFDESNSEELLADAKKYLETAKEIQKEWYGKAKKNDEDMKQLSKIGTEIQRMKPGSIALVDQITTVSKMRIYDPRNARGVLSGIKLSPESMDKVNEKLKELFVF